MTLPRPAAVAEVPAQVPADNRVETALEKANQIFARVTLEAKRFVIIAAELLFRNVAVIALDLLLGAQLRAEVGQFALAALAMLTRTIFAAVYRAFRTAPNILAKTAINFMLCVNTLCHRCSSSFERSFEERAHPLPNLSDRQTDFQ